MQVFLEQHYLFFFFFFFFYFFLFIFFNTLFFRTEIPLALSNGFLINFPIDPLEEQDSCKEEKTSCVSGDALSSVTDPDGCEVRKKEKTRENYFFRSFYKI